MSETGYPGGRVLPPARFTLIVGPMKSGKSHELIHRFAPLQFAKGIRYGLFQPRLNVRDAQIASRNGVRLDATKIDALSEIDPALVDIVGIDELHMFSASDADAILRLLLAGVSVVASGLDMDYRGRLYDIVRRCLEFGPDSVLHCQAVCDACGQFSATHTVVKHGGRRLFDGLPSVLPDDGAYTYEAHCRACFMSAPSGFGSV